ncbi:MAG: RNA polymerase sigma factor [candidate division Zixibacteria bacterium]
MKSDNLKGKIDDDLFKEAIVNYKERIFLVILKYVRNRDDAKDLTQEAFLRAYRSRNSFRGESSLYTWIFRIAVNLALNFKERSRVSDHSSLDDSPPLYSDSDPLETVKSRELSSSIDRAVKLLPERQRMTFVLRYYEEMPFARVAENLGITEGAAKANYHQALKKLKGSLQPFMEREL